MTKRKTLWNVISEQRKKECVDDMIAFFEESRGETIGVLAAEEIVDVVMEKIQISAYNKGIDDAKMILAKKFEDTNLDLDILRK